MQQKILKNILCNFNKMTTEAERKNWVGLKRLELEQNFYGLPPLTTSIHNGLTYPAIKELIVRMNVFAVKGVKDEGQIKYPEANRMIHYRLDPTNLNKCVITLKALDKKVRYMYVDKSQILRNDS